MHCMQNSEVPMMSRQHFTQQLPGDTAKDEAIIEKANDNQEDESHPFDRPPTSTPQLLTGLTPFLLVSFAVCRSAHTFESPLLFAAEDSDQPLLFQYY